jgi:hypothetical protein
VDELIRAKRPLIIGIGGGGDVVGALALAEYCRLYHGADPIVGGVAWERQPIDPEPGPRRADEIEGAGEIAPAVLAAGPQTKVAGRDVRFAEARVAELLGVQVVLLDLNVGPRRLAAGLAAAVERVDCDLVVFLDVGGDVLAHGDEPGLGSPLCDAIMLAAADQLREAGVPVLGAIFGIGCDGELTPTEVLERLSEVGQAGGLVGAVGLTPGVAALLERAVEAVPTEASAQALHAFHGARGEVPIRGGRRTVILSAVAVVTFFFGVAEAMGSAARLALAVRDAADLDEANAKLTDLGVRTELDWERDAAHRPD